MIYVAILDEHPVACDAIKALLHDADDIIIRGCNTTFNELINKLASEQTHVVLLVLYQPDENDIENIRLLNQRFPKVKILVLSMFKQ